MNSYAKKTAVGFLLLCLIGSIYWGFIIYKYDSNLGTENVFTITDNQSFVSDNDSDILLDLEFNSGTDNLDWALTKVILVKNGTEFQCTTGGLISLSEDSEKIKSSLVADGVTFNVAIDAISDNFVYLDVGDMEQSNESDYTIKFSKTDIFLGENVVGLYTDELLFSQLNYSDVKDENYSESSEERLDWYDYNLSVHRVEAKDRVYIIDDGSSKYKIQFLSYYNSNDEQRQISMIVSWIDGESFQALNDPEKVQPSPCILIDTDQNENQWSSNETIYVKENNFQICNSSCELLVQLYYQDIIVEGNSSIVIY
jgi:hypothetical protein